jgi:hypothetical protein
MMMVCHQKRAVDDFNVKSARRVDSTNYGYIIRYTQFVA